ncbi:hypothetical protein GJJ30_25635 [Larkinella terrae]|uniref:Uncharacterized protein n=1 Tax=Larkinella terrae TaxID=2025311 RepID=A0A7K0ESB6_9BACT|nr:hypothetical protein [Larkinella terrae]
MLFIFPGQLMRPQDARSVSKLSGGSFPGLECKNRSLQVSEEVAYA